jgi:hypothetical protein
MTLTLGLLALATVGGAALLGLTGLLLWRFPVHVLSLAALLGVLAADWTAQLSTLVTMLVGTCLYGLYALLRFVCERPTLAGLVIIVLSASFVRVAIEGARALTPERRARIAEPLPPARRLPRPYLGSL